LKPGAASDHLDPMSAAPAPVASRPIEGILWMLASGLCFVAVNGIVRYLGTDLPAAQSAFLRFAWGVVFLLPTLAGLLRQGLPPGTAPLFLGRGLVHGFAVMFWFFAMARLPVAEVTAIGYLNPVIVTVGAVVFFGERLALRRILAIAVALLGALIVLRPGLRDILPGHLAQLCAATLFAASYLFAKRLSAMAEAGVVVAMLSLAVTVVLAPFAWAVWVPVGWPQLGWLGLVAAFATVAHYCMTRAFSAAPLSVTQPVTFLQLVWATLLGSLAFGEPVDPFVLLGGAVIIGAISYIAWREGTAHKRAVTPPPEATKL
jgi:drug/metabolite transporter (DMT)-like permease